MGAAVIESGVIIFIGIAFLMIKLPRRVLLTLLAWPLALDFVVSAAAYALHWGTFSGVMAAAVAGMLMSGFTSCARWAIGYIERGRHVPGFFTVRA